MFTFQKEQIAQAEYWKIFISFFSSRKIKLTRQVEAMMTFAVLTLFIIQ